MVSRLNKINKLAIMGGTFDPIHIGHLVTAEVVRSEFEIDEVVFIPTGHPPHKSQVNMTTTEHRYLMTVLATEANPHFKVSRIEIEREGVTYTIDTVKQLKKMYGKEVQLYFITGADAIHQILTWKESEDLLQICDFIAVTRPGYKKEELKQKVEQLKEEYNSKIHFLEVPALAISSSDIRQRVAKNQPIKYLVPDSVENYIAKYYLYQQKNILTDELTKEMMDYVSKRLSPKRYAHTKGVVEMAIEMARMHDLDLQEVLIAALFHDVAKELPKEEKLKLAKEYNVDLDQFEKRNIDIAHGKIGAALLQHDWKIENENILNAIRYHTVGRKQMSDLEKVIFLADMTESGRRPFKGQAEIIRLSTYDLDKAMYKALCVSKEYVQNQLNAEVHPLTDSLIREYNEEG